MFSLTSGSTGRAQCDLAARLRLKQRHGHAARRRPRRIVVGDAAVVHGLGAHDRMVEEVAADAEQPVLHRDAMRRQRCYVADARFFDPIMRTIFRGRD
jgi:hypothetical protein